MKTMKIQIVWKDKWGRKNIIKVDSGDIDINIKRNVEKIPDIFGVSLPICKNESCVINIIPEWINNKFFDYIRYKRKFKRKK